MEKSKFKLTIEYLDKDNIEIKVTPEKATEDKNFGEDLNIALLHVLRVNLIILKKINTDSLEAQKEIYNSVVKATTDMLKASFPEIFELVIKQRDNKDKQLKVIEKIIDEKEKKEKTKNFVQNKKHVN